MSVLTIRRAFTASLLGCLSLSAALAGAPDEGVLDEVVVTATRVAQPLAQALAPVLLIDRATLEDSLAGDVGDVLRFHAGLDLGRAGGPGQPMSLFIRGANSDQSIVMIDGVRINSGTLALAPLMNISPELFERIEVVKGPRSAIYGTDAIGGVVNLITRTGGGTGGAVMLDYGRYDTLEFAADGHYTAGDSSAQAALTGQQSAGFPTFAADSVDRGYKNLSGTVALSTRIGGVELGARYWQATGRSDYANPPGYDSAGNFIPNYTPLDEAFSDSALAAHIGGDLSGNWHARASLSRVVDDLQQHQLDGYNVPPIPDYDRTRRDTLDVQNDVKVAGVKLNQLLTFGAIVANERTDALSFGTGYAIDTHTQVYFLQDQLEAGRSRLLLAAGAAHHPAFGDHTTWNVEYGFAPAPALLLTMSAGTAFRAPSATDRFGFGGNPNLLPESSRNFEAGFKARVSRHQEISFAAFQDTITGLIISVYDPTPADQIYFGYQNENIDRARIRGLEASWELRVEPWSVQAEASVQDPRDLVNDTPLSRRTKRSVSLSGTRVIGRGEVGLDLLQAGARPDIDVNTLSAVQDGGYLLVALRGKWNLTPAWSIDVRLDNALNRQYQLANGYNTAGRALSVATRYGFH